MLYKKIRKHLKLKLTSFFTSPIANRLPQNLAEDSPPIDAVILSWNRLELLKKTIYSLLATGPCNMKLTIVDNASSDETQKWLRDFCRNHDRSSVIFLEENCGGKAFNSAFKNLSGEFILFSENDMEYLPGWWLEMLNTFSQFPLLGQLSPLSPFPDNEDGEIWTLKPYEELKENDHVLFKASGNVGTSCMVRRKVLHQGIRWENISSQNNKVKFPADATFSSDIKKLGYLVAWSKKALVKNWGHNIEEWTKNKDYYQENWAEKAAHSIDNLEQLQSDSNLQDRAILLQQLESLRSRFLQLQQNFPDKEYLKKLGTEPIDTRLYIADRKGFSSKNILSQKTNPLSETFSITFDLNPEQEIQSLRWDPVENIYCALSINKVSLRKGENSSLENYSLDKLSYSEHINKDGQIYFTSTDPQVFIKTKGPLKQIQISGTWQFNTPIDGQLQSRS